MQAFVMCILLSMRCDLEYCSWDQGMEYSNGRIFNSFLHRWKVRSLLFLYAYCCWHNNSEKSEESWRRKKIYITTWPYWKIESHLPNSHLVVNDNLFSNLAHLLSLTNKESWDWPLLFVGWCHLLNKKKDRKEFFYIILIKSKFV